MQAQQFLSHWLGLWSWVHFLHRQLAGTRLVTLYTFRKGSIELIFEGDSGSCKLIWSKISNTARLSFFEGGSVPRKRVGIFSHLPETIGFEAIEIHPEDRMVKMSLSQGIELVFGFYPETLNVFQFEHGTLNDQFLKRPAGIDLKQKWSTFAESEAEFIARWSKANIPGDPIPEFQILEESGEIQSHKGGMLIPELTRKALSIRSAPKKATAINWRKIGQTVRNRWRRKLRALLQEQEKSLNWPLWESEAQAINIALSAGLKPAGNILELPEELSPSGKTLTITISPDANSLSDISGALYKRVKKARSRLEHLEAQIPQVESEISELDSLLENEDEQLLATFLREHGEAEPGSSQKPAKRRPYKKIKSPGGTDILVGRGARDNDELTFHVASKNDWWFHARGVHGSHVILRSGRSEPDQQDLLAAARAAAQHSDAKHSRIVVVQYCQRRHLSKPKGSAPGFVRIHQEETITIDLDE